MSGFSHTVLQVVPRLGAGGAERTTLEMAGAIVDAGGRALVASAGGRLEDDILRAGGEVVHLPVHRRDPVSILRMARALEEVVKTERVDLVHARSRAPAWSAMMAARKAGKPFVTTFHGAHSAGNPLKKWYNSSLVRADRVIANSRFTGDKITAEYGLEADKVRIIPRGADLRLFNPEALDPARVNAVLEDWALPETAAQSVKFLLPARLTAWKGHEWAINAAAALKSQTSAGKCPALTLVFCGGAQGERDYEQSLRAKIDQRGVRDMVHLVGECADMPAAYAWADAVLAPSLRPEPFGRTIVEAGAMGKPVIASAHGGATETVIDGGTGLLVEPMNVDGLAGAMARLAGDRDVREGLGDNARARVRAVYSSEAMCDATLAVYRELLGSDRGERGA